MHGMAKSRYSLKWPKPKKVNLSKSLGKFLKVAITGHK